jgi:hypothetical protein
MRTYLGKKPSQKRAGGVAEGEFKPHYHKTKQNKNSTSAPYIPNYSRTSFQW